MLQPVPPTRPVGRRPALCVSYKTGFLREYAGGRLYPNPSVDARRVRDILKEEIGKLPAKVEPVG
jgi:hypothetical protein